MNVFTLFLYVVTIISFVLYVLFKYRKRSYIISCFNIMLFVYFVSYLLTPVFYFSKLSWKALGVTNLQEYRPYLNECLTVNSLGFLVMIVSMLFVEFGTTYKKKNGISKLSRHINKIYIDFAFFITTVAWYWIVFIYNNHELPLFNGGRDFYVSQAISPIYLALNELLTIFSIYYGVRFIYDKSDINKFALSGMTLLFSGARAAILLSVIVPIFVIALYIRKGDDPAKLINDKKRKRKATYKMLIVVVAVGFFGLFLQFIREGDQSKVNILTLLNEFLYGNTFSDFRDGAFILRGYRVKYGHTLLLGKSYLAGLISFIPSRFSRFRQTWAWGHFTTETLFGFHNHAGFRGGNSMEAYLNFGILGVVVVSCLQGVVIGYLEKQFNYLILNKMGNKIYDMYLFLFALLTLYSNLVVSASMYNLYVDFLFLLILCIASTVAPIKLPRIRFRIFKRR